MKHLRQMWTLWSQLIGCWGETLLKKIKIQMDNFGHCCPNNNLTSSTALKRKLWGTFSFNQSEETLICWRFDSNVAIFHTNRLATLLCHIFCRYETAVYFDQCIHVKCGLGRRSRMRPLNSRPRGDMYSFYAVFFITIWKLLSSLSCSIRR